MRTALYQRHLDLGGKMVTFAGWQMPIQYRGIIEEHKTVREKVGVFDVSHMGRILIEGDDAAHLLDYLGTNPILSKKPGTATYTCWCNDCGGTVDDLIVYRNSDTSFYIIVNAGNREKDLHHLLDVGKDFLVTITSRYDEDGILAIQGPEAPLVMAQIFPEMPSLSPMHVSSVQYDGVELMLSTTGYTGAGGFELAGPADSIVKVWDRLIEMGVEPIGLGARDTLRLEMGYALYGHELSETIAPTESVSAWTVKGEGRSFYGKEALPKIPRFQYPVVVTGKGIAREGCVVWKDAQQIGSVTSGTFSPTLNRAIALVLVDRLLKKGDVIELQIRERRVEAEVAALPFLSQPIRSKE